jgi:hypothetical protein
VSDIQGDRLDAPALGAEHQPVERVVSMVLGRADELCAEPSDAAERGRM